ncbi:HAD family hydrolase [Arthrobacter cryoconiti]|uniref:HAD family hydrolase n=1 Tax=Arthrobacter cryoconiti TaxID=748907 RepID=A0ABV8R3B5_9MICC|nr:HAD family phosphatase [Arthrobacter cryoconiti]MCC9069853.1 HAD family phosphatase [Arthrobacter cryoconiti]
MPLRPDSPVQETSPAGSNSPPALKAALWDMDGTLVDTEPYWVEAEIDLVRSHGGHWDTELATQLVGSALEDSAAVLQEAGVQLSIREIVDHLSNRVIDAVRREIPWRPGAPELLAELHGRGVRCVLVTMSEHALATEVVKALAEPYFEFLITGDQVLNGKPHPEPYLKAVERLRTSDSSLTVAHCVALEDSIPGVASAMAAGVATIAIPHFVALASAPGQTTWTTLAGKNYDDVAALLSVEARL